MNNGNVPLPDGQYKAERADIVIIGNGIAGLTCAVEARRLKPDASIVMMTDQSHPTINTPALKQFAVGKLTQEQLLAYPVGTEHAQRIHVVNTHVEAIHAQDKYVCLSGGRGFGYDALLIATGSKATGLSNTMPGHNFDGVITLHRLQDYLNLRRWLSDVDDAVVIGGGAHAIETVMSLLHLGIHVHWLIRGKTFLTRMLDQPASEMVLEHMRHLGAQVYTETHVAGIVGRVGSVAGVVTNQQQMLPCQLVLACTGTTPVTTLAERCSIPMLYQGGILVDDQLRTNARDIYAAGDVAALKHPQTGAYETRPRWYEAVLQGRTVAAMMTGQQESAPPAFGVPWHATQLGELSMLSVGDLQDVAEDEVTFTDSGKKSYRRMSIAGDKLVSYLALGPTQPDSLAIKRIIDEGLSIRDIKTALLKGDFDARKYFSQQQSRVARDMVTSGKVPAVNWLQNSLSVVRSQTRIPAILKSSLSYTSGKLLAVSQTNHTQATRAEVRTTEPLGDPRSTTEPLPDQPAMRDTEEEETYALTSAIPALSKEVPHLASPADPASRNFWSYSSELPAREKQPSRHAKKGQFVIIGER